ncbi:MULTISPECIES: Do family serine endopeptidase [Agrobacterium tumefaciens complex]|jgi:serine protease Do|uniref:Probable periplasmic serine endoprotease DegP-like n=2 Tax=Agrobacterium tumefaciens complex TaxID=1183400 RepID=A0A1S7NS23_AGRTU|nr:MULTISPECIES: Do family serine endopeptidase [Agrobacterium tumefaciens complex]MCP2134233.1 serine protease Do [Rhizobium sp. SLBN-94]TGE80462.1 Do family serine endopeptidase [Rhizobium sp. SEMIA 439]AYM81554.1 htrA family protein [Agrobacterium tumefaciens]KAA1237359.1 Do family serine endopeptidase [Agrobacterium tumefaciens]KAB0460745.1 Do family serine endopeptidase [Agrobacterium tumefaciens]
MAVTLLSPFRSSIAAIAGIALVAGSLTAPVAALAQSHGPESVADLAEPLLDAVVNISTSQNVKTDGKGPVPPKLPEGSPFQEFFKDYFDSQKPEGGEKVNSLGSGFVIDPAGYVVTNNHVIEGADAIEVIFPNGSKLKATLVGTDTKTDLSVLKVEPKTPLKAVKFGDSRSMRIGDWVMAIGNPFGLGGSLTVGVISARGRNINAGPYDNFIQTDAAINKGNSGGPLFNMKGEVIGINTAIISPSGGSIGIGFAVPTELAQNIVQQLIEFGETRRGWLGVRVQPVTDDVAASLGMDSAKGALISGVAKGGPVENGPIQAGDVVLKFDGKDIHEMRDLLRIVAESPVGKDVDVVILRDGKEETVKVKLGQLQDATDEKASADDQQSEDGDGGVVAPEDDGGTDDQAQDQTPEVREAPQSVLGMNLVVLSNELRTEKGIAESVEGVLVASVDAGSPAEQKGMKAGDIIVEVGQDFMEVPGDVLVRVNGLKSEGRKNAHMMVADAQGNLRVVALPLE